MAVTSNSKDSSKKEAVNKENGGGEIGKKSSSATNGSSANLNDLEIGASITAKRTDGSWHSANVVHRRTNPDTNETEYYVHYEGFNRRLDEWIKSDRIKFSQDKDQVVPIANEADRCGLSAFVYNMPPQTS